MESQRSSGGRSASDDVKDSCLICTSPLLITLSSRSFGEEEEGNQQDKLKIGGDDKSEHVDKKEVDLFALRYLLEVPEDSLGLDGGDLEGRVEWKDVGLCDVCIEDVMTARKLYRKLVKILKQFRRIQRDIVEEMRRKQANKEGKWSEFVKAREYSFCGPFVIRTEGFEEVDDVANEETGDGSGCDEDAEEEIEHAGWTGVCSLPSDSDPLNLESEEGGSAEFEDMEDEKVSSGELDSSSSPIMLDDEEEDDKIEFHNPPPFTSVPDSMFQKPPPPEEPVASSSRRSSRKRKLETRDYYEDMAIEKVSLLPPPRTSPSTGPEAPEIGSGVLPRPIKVTTHYCPKCFKGFGNKGAMKSHLTIVHKPTESRKVKAPVPVNLPQTCDLCRTQFPTDSLLLQHLTQKHGVKEYISNCPYPPCPLVFSTSFSLRRHLLLNTRSQLHSFQKDDTDTRNLVEKLIKYPYVCGTCKKDLPDIKALQAHLSHVHETSGASRNLSCPVANCPEKYCNRQSVEVHIFLKHDVIQMESETIQKCSGCARPVQIQNMESHLKVSHRSSRIIKCCHCPFLFSKSEYYIEHLYSDHRKKGLPFSCDICSEEDDLGVTFPDHIQLRKHYFEEHQIGQQFPCDQCEDEDRKSFWTKALLNAHVKSVHEKKVKDTFSCDLCSDLDTGSDVTFFKSSHMLETHNIIVHGAEPLRCPHCPETFMMRKRFLAHVREVHKGLQKEGPVSCQEAECNGKLFSNNHQLKQHQTKFHGERKHLCDHCGKGYPTQWQLKQHVNRFHLRVGAVVCEECGESFQDEKVLRIHKLIHTGERPFGCPQCGQRFRQKSVLTTHLKSHQEKGESFRPTGPMKHIRKRVQHKNHMK